MSPFLDEMNKNIGADRVSVGDKTPSTTATKNDFAKNNLLEIPSIQNTNFVQVRPESISFSGSKIRIFLKFCICIIFSLLFSLHNIKVQHIQALQIQDGRVEVFTTGYHIYQQGQGNFWSTWHKFIISSYYSNSLEGKKSDGSIFTILIDMETINTCYQVGPNSGWNY